MLLIHILNVELHGTTLAIKNQLHAITYRSKKIFKIQVQKNGPSHIQWNFQRRNIAKIS